MATQTSVTTPSVLAQVVRGLDDAELAKLARAAHDEVLVDLLRGALGEAAASPTSKTRPSPASAPRAAEPVEPAARATRAPKESSRGPRPTQRVTQGVQRLLDALASGPRTTGQLAESLGVTKSAVRQAAARAGKRVRSSRPGGRKSDQIFEAAT